MDRFLTIKRGNDICTTPSELSFIQIFVCTITDYFSLTYSVISNYFSAHGWVLKNEKQNSISSSLYISLESVGASQDVGKKRYRCSKATETNPKNRISFVANKKARTNQ